MKKVHTYHSQEIFARLSILLLAICTLILAGCSDNATNSGLATDTDISQQTASSGFKELTVSTIEETMQISPHMINLQSIGASESVLAIIGLPFPAGYYLTDFDFTLSFNGEDVIEAYDCYYCYVDNNLIISFNKNDIISNPVTLGIANTEAVAAVNGYYRIGNGDDSYDTWLSKVAGVQILNPSKADLVKE